MKKILWIILLFFPAVHASQCELNFHKINFEKFFAQCHQEAEQNNPNAQFNLALVYDEGKGVGQDKQKAAYWYTKAAEQGYLNAQNNLAAMYFNGEGTEADKQKAFFWFEKAAAQGNPFSQYNVAIMYYNGNGVEQNRSLAKEYFKQSCDQAFQKACDELEK